MRNMTAATITSTVRAIVVTAILTALAAPDAFAQEQERLRRGFWFNGGLGFGTAGCETCQDDPSGGIVAAIAVGGTLSQHVLLGASANVWGKEESDSRLTVGAFTAAIRLYPSSTGRFYFLAGLGVSSRAIETDLADDTTLTVSDNGTAAIIGLGYDFRIENNVNLTPFINLAGTDFDGQGTGFSQFGLSITVY